MTKASKAASKGHAMPHPVKPTSGRSQSRNAKKSERTTSQALSTANPKMSWTDPATWEDVT